MISKAALGFALLATLSVATTHAGGFTLCNSLGGGSRVCTTTGDEGGGSAMESNLGRGSTVGRDLNGGTWTRNCAGTWTSRPARLPASWTRTNSHEREPTLVPAAPQIEADIADRRFRFLERSSPRVRLPAASKRHSLAHG